MRKRRLFLGSSKEAADAGALTILKRELSRNLLSVEVVSWLDTDWQNLESALKTLTQSLTEFSYAVFLAWPDDTITIRTKQYYCCRDNVIFEFGLFLGQLDTKRTFLIAPERGIKIPPDNLQYRFLSDIHGTFLAGHYKLTGSPPTPTFDLANLLSRINGLEKTILDATPQSAQKELRRKIYEAQNSVTKDGYPDAYYSGYLRNTIDQLVHLKAASSSKSAQDAAQDLLLVLDAERDVCDIKQLTQIQRHDVSKLSAVWVFADSPLEFQPSPSKEFQDLRRTIRDNLLNGVKYRYFISEAGHKSINLDLIIPSTLSTAQKTKLKRNLTFVLVDKKLFKTYFTLHFQKGLSSPTAVYMSMLREDRKKDLLIQVAEARHVERITENIELLFGKNEKHNDTDVKRFV